MTWPNRITYLRILLVPIFAIAALEVREYPFFKYIAVALFGLIAIGDAIDGYVAVKFNQSTVEGKFIDPLADKLLMTTASVFLALPLWDIPSPDWAGRPPLLPEIAIIIISRDILISLWVLVTFMIGVKIDYHPSHLGKATTLAQMLMLTTMMVGTMSVWVLEYVATPLSYVAASLTIASGIHYLVRYGKEAANQLK